MDLAHQENVKIDNIVGKFNEILYLNNKNNYFENYIEDMNLVEDNDFLLI